MKIWLKAKVSLDSGLNATIIELFVQKMAPEDKKWSLTQPDKIIIHDFQKI